MGSLIITVLTMFQDAADGTLPPPTVDSYLPTQTPFFSYSFCVYQPCKGTIFQLINYLMSKMFFIFTEVTIRRVDHLSA